MGGRVQLAEYVRQVGILNLHYAVGKANYNLVFINKHFLNEDKLELSLPVPLPHLLELVVKVFHFEEG